MPTIHLETFIRAPAELCFDLSRSVDIHMASTDYTGERAVDGVTSGMMSLGDEVTWEAKHFGVRQRLTSRITAMERPRLFVDEMQRGAFKSWHHTHLFEPREDGTLMIDDARYSSPLGPVGRIIDRLFLEKYMTRLLVVRNAHIKRVAEAQC
ncbi:MAG TPA: SRPBCC family protein [Pyrinomonadaceae bacterium]|jgi:ligand-binding SRPBCC domain-containing protein|nr:SRPBCC family protein [Pyrinomonadaceae bacterium]